MAKQWMSRMVRLVWTIARDPVRRNRWWRRIKRGCGISLILLLLLGCLSCLLLGITGRATHLAGGPNPPGRDGGAHR